MQYQWLDNNIETKIEVVK